jgi:flagellar biogenesis protein FliO
MVCAKRSGLLPVSRRIAGSFSVCALTLWGAFRAAAEESGHVFGGLNSGSVAASVQVVSPSGANSISLLGYILTILVLLAAGLAVLLRGSLPFGLKAASKAERKLRIEETKAVGHKQFLLVAEYEGRRFLLGVCPGRIDYLSGLDSEVAVPAGSFQELLQPNAADKSAMTGDKSISTSDKSVAATDKSVAPIS